jgi:hypothetical protein
MGAVFLVLGILSMTGGAVLLMPYSYIWMERMGSARRWAYGIGLLIFGIALLAVGEAVG